MRSCRTCSPVNPLYCLFLFTGCLIKRDRKHDIPALKLRRNYVNSRSFWNPGLYLNSRKVGASSYSNKKTELSKHTNMTTKISCLDKPRFLNKNPPTQKDPLKKVFKTASLQFRGGSLPNVVQTAKAARRKPTKTQQL